MREVKRGKTEKTISNLLPVLKIYNARDMNYTFPILAVNFETQPK